MRGSIVSSVGGCVKLSTTFCFRCCLFVCVGFFVLLFKLIFICRWDQIASLSNILRKNSIQLNARQPNTI